MLQDAVSWVVQQGVRWRRRHLPHGPNMAALYCLFLSHCKGGLLLLDYHICFFCYNVFLRPFFILGIFCCFVVVCLFFCLFFFCFFHHDLKVTPIKEETVIKDKFLIVNDAFLGIKIQTQLYIF